MCQRTGQVGQPWGLLPEGLRPAFAQHVAARLDHRGTSGSSTYLVTATRVTSSALRPLRPAASAIRAADAGHVFGDLLETLRHNAFSAERMGIRH